MKDGMNSGNNSMAMISEHDVTRVIAGDVESVRQRLIVALEQIGYRVLSENPLRARHNARNAAAYLMSANALEYPTRLEIGLKPQGQGATQVTFDYQVQHGAFGKGDRQTLTREAEAILALASQRAQALSCAGCGAEIVHDSRFCRKCGAPIRTNQPAELEVMRLTAGARAGYQWTVIGTIIFLFASIFPAIAAILNKPMKVPMFLAMLVSIFGAWALGAGLRRTHLTLNPREDKDREDVRPPQYTPVVMTPHITNELPTQSTYRSVTEGTTDLLPPLEETDSVPAPRRNERSRA